jgi:hypothetical protein
VSTQQPQKETAAMPDSSAQGANAHSLNLSKETVAAKTPRVLIVCPASLQLSEVQALKFAAEDAQCSVSLYRTADDFRLKDVRDEMRDRTRPFSHLLLVLGQLNGFDDTILHEADSAKIPNVGFFALHHRDAFDRHSRRIGEDKVGFLIVRTPAEHAHVRTRWNSVQTLIVEDIEADASRICELLIGNLRPRQPTVTWT